MTTITIHRGTYRDAACAQTEDLDVFDAEADRIFAAITEKAANAGLTITIKDGRSHGPSYTVDGEDYDAEQAAHDFMQSPSAEFWSYL
jgi:uroporphyrinogen-III decarboxylase